MELMKKIRVAIPALLLLVPAFLFATENIRDCQLSWSSQIAEIEQQLKSLLSHTHDLVVELPTQGVLNVRGFNKQFKSLDDGVHLYRRKGVT